MHKLNLLVIYALLLYGQGASHAGDRQMSDQWAHVQQVACLTDNEAHLAVEKDDPYLIQRKPHGHGDVHALLHSTGLVKKWQRTGVKWVCFFQDTNGLVFRALPAALGKPCALHLTLHSCC